MLEEGKAGGFFGLDMARETFDSLEDVSPEELVTFAHRYLKSFSHVPLDPDQQAAWDEAYGPIQGQPG